MGIAEDDLNAVFEQFRQVDGSSTRRAGGTGLGLTITRHSIHLHDGEIYVESEVGKGFNFLVHPAHLLQATRVSEATCLISTVLYVWNVVPKWRRILCPPLARSAAHTGWTHVMITRRSRRCGVTRRCARREQSLWRYAELLPLDIARS